MSASVVLVRNRSISVHRSEMRRATGKWRPAANHINHRLKKPIVPSLGLEGREVEERSEESQEKRIGSKYEGNGSKSSGGLLTGLPGLPWSRKRR